MNNLCKEDDGKRVAKPEGYFFPIGIKGIWLNERLKDVYAAKTSNNGFKLYHKDGRSFSEEYDDLDKFLMTICALYTNSLTINTDIIFDKWGIKIGGATDDEN